MPNRIIEIADDQRHLSMFRGFMIIEATGRARRELGRIPLDDIGAVIANAHRLSCTNNLLISLAERGAPFVLRGANHHDVGLLFSVDGNH
jgi:CRISPR-associated protein Cas1